MRLTLNSSAFIFVITMIVQTAPAAEAQRLTIMGNFPDSTDGVVDADNNVHIVYSDQKTPHAYYRVFPADRSPPTAAVDVSDKSQMVVGCERGPKIALGNGGSVYVIWQTGDSLVCARSAKGGVEAGFDLVPLLDKQMGVDVPNIGNDDAGTVYAVWVDHRHPTYDSLGAELYMARTDESGRFGKNVRISDEKFPVCPCCLPEIQCSGKMIYVLYRSSKSGIKEMILRRADRAKMDWTTTVIGKDNWKFEGCPMSGGHLAASEKDVVATWASDGKFYVATSNNQGKSFTPQRTISSVRRLPLPALDYLFADRDPLDLETLKPEKDGSTRLDGRVMNIAWRGAEKNIRCLIMQASMMRP